MSKPLLDFPGLDKRIQELLKEYKPPAIPQEFVARDTELTSIISRLIYKNVTNRSKYWRAAGIEMRTDRAFTECKDKFAAVAKVIGQGAFGTMFDVPSPPCLTKIPKGVSRVAIKIEKIGEYFDFYQSPPYVMEAYKIAKKAAELDIGPKIYDVFVTLNEAGYAQIVKVQELIHGSSWENMQWKSDAQKKKAVAILEKKIVKMNKNGILHHDLHTGNVMVTKDDVYIVDFDRANFSSEEESGQLISFNQGRKSRWEANDPLLQYDALAFVYDALLSEGSIRVAGSKNSKNGNTNSKTRKNRK